MMRNSHCVAHEYAGRSVVMSWPNRKHFDEQEFSLSGPQNRKRFELFFFPAKNTRGKENGIQFSQGI